MRLLAVDPGYEQSAFVVFNGVEVCDAALLSNPDLLHLLRTATMADRLVIERIENMGMPAGVTTFRTVFWSGRFAEAYDLRGLPWFEISRRDVKLHLCGSARAKDANIRQVLIDRFGPRKEAAIGTKKAPGPLYGIKSHQWAALAVAVTFWDRRDWDKSIAEVKAQTEAF